MSLDPTTRKRYNMGTQQSAGRDAQTSGQLIEKECFPMATDDTPPVGPARKPISRRVRFEIFRRDNHTCQYCGATAPDAKLTVDHVVPAALGGSDDPSNLVTACHPCNSGKGSTSPDEHVVAAIDEKALQWKQAVRRSISVWLSERAGADLLHDEFLAAWNIWKFDDGSTVDLENDWRISYDNWINAGVDPEIIIGLIRPAMQKNGITSTRWRYFCWLVWRTADEIKERAQRFMEASEE